MNIECTMEGIQKVYPELVNQANCYKFQVQNGQYLGTTAPTSNTFEIWIGTSPYAHTWLSGGTVKGNLG